jgi:hypothetical protein
MDNTERMQDDLEEQMDEMYYALTCDICGESILKSLLLKDFEEERYFSSLAATIRAHNKTHYIEPTIYACEDDDIFGVLHTQCTHA